MSAFKSAVIARTCSAIRMTGKSLASLAISSKFSEPSRSNLQPFFMFFHFGARTACFQMKVDLDI
jgi:hypothetical protein